MSILNDLYYGRLRFDERRLVPGSEEERLTREVVDMEQIFHNELSDSAKRWYDLYVEKVDRIAGITAYESFTQGFRLGVQLMQAAKEPGGE